MRKPLSEADRFVMDDLARMQIDTDQHNRPTNELLSQTPYGVSEKIEISAAGKRKRSRRGKASGTGVPAVKSHKVKSMLDVYGQYIPQEDQDALMRFLYDSELATTVNLTASYGDAGGGSFGPRHGGVPDRMRIAHNRFAFVKSNLDARSLNLMKELILASRWQERRPLTVVEVAQSHAAHLRHRQSLIAFGMGLVAATAWTVRDLYEQWDKATKPDRRHDTRIQQGRRERAAR